MIEEILMAVMAGGHVLLVQHRRRLCQSGEAASRNLSAPLPFLRPKHAEQRWRNGTSRTSRSSA
ncbi:MAG: hypothetical protein Q8Q85_11460, partial [Gemmatimonadales bacterium]|nr:hypothetical protein [Gemmatimonadales bacterium]